jgi:hypothetical protein
MKVESECRVRAEFEFRLGGIPLSMVSAGFRLTASIYL